MAVRNDKTIVLFAAEGSYGVAPGSGWHRLGFHDSITLPDPAFEWYPQYKMNTLKRGRILRGKPTFMGSVQGIRIVDPFFLNMCFPLDNASSVDEFSPLPSFSIAVGQFGEDGTMTLGRVFTGGKINKATIGMNAEEDLVLNIDEMLFNGYTHTRLTAAPVRYANFFPSQVAALSGDDRYVFAGANIQIIGLVILHLTKFQLTISNNLTPYYGLRSQTFLDQALQPKYIFENKLEYRGEFMVDMRADNDFALWDAYTSQGGFSVLANFTNRTGSLVLRCSPFSFNSNYNGSMFEKNEVQLDATKGVPSATLTANIDRITVN